MPAFRVVHVDQERRFALEIDDETGRTYVSFPVRNQYATYDEWYEVDRETFSGFVLDPAAAHDFVDAAKRRELDHLLLLQPGRERGYPE